MNMKMQNKKQHGAAVFIKEMAAFIVMAVLFSSCLELYGANLETASASAEEKAVVTLVAAIPARTIITGVDLASFTYTLKGTVSGGTEQTLFEGKSYADFNAAGALLVDPGTWSFTAEAYSGTTKVLSGTTSADLSAGAATIPFTLRAVAVSGGHSTVNVTLRYPHGSGVAKVTAALYVSPVAADSGTSLTLTAGTPYDSAAFSSSAVIPAEEQYVRFFLYDNKNVCIGVYTESVYAVSGCTATFTRTLENINMFTVTVTVNKNGAAWTDSGKSVILKKGTVSYTLTAATGAATYTASVPNGTYAVYSGDSGSEADTSVTVTAKTDGTAEAAVDYYSVTYDGNGNTGGTVPGEQIRLKGAAAITIAANNIERTGYLSNGWNTAADGTGTAYAAGDTYSTDAALTLYAVWTANTYKVAFMANGGDGSMADESFTYGTTQALTAITFTYENYTFCGWATTDTSTAPDYYDQKKVLNLTTEADGTVTLYAIWINNTDNTAPVTLPPGIDGSADTTGTYMYFGSWPQIIKAQSVSVSDTPTKTMGANSYYLGSDGYWYAKVTAKTYNNATNYTFTDGTTVTKGDVYYFKVEPIKWRVLETGKLLAESVLANVAYYPYYNNRTIENKKVYPNNYQYSRIRAYLNGLSYDEKSDTSLQTENTEFSGKGFLQTAFTATAKEKIATANVDNSAASTTDADSTTTGVNGDGTNPNACDNTSDKIYLLSLKEVTDSATYQFGKYTAYDTKRRRTVSDYARATGAYMNTTAGDYQYRGWWWLRSPNSGFIIHARDVYLGGPAASSYLVDRTDGGVVPALSITQ